MRISDIAEKLVILPTVPFAINQQRQSVLESKLTIAACILGLALQLIRKRAHFHGTEAL